MSLKKYLDNGHLISFATWSLLPLLFSGVIIAVHAFIFDINADPRLVLQPWLLNNGFIPYVNIADEHTPLLPVILAIVMRILHQDAITTLRLAHGTIIGITAFVGIMWVLRKHGRFAALATALFLFAYSNRFGYWGMWHNLAIAPLFLACYILLTSPMAGRILLKMGLLGTVCGTAILVKQQGIILLFLCLLWLLSYVIYERVPLKQPLKLGATLATATFIPLGLYTLYYQMQGGTWEALLYWPLFFNLKSGYNEIGRLWPSIQEVLNRLPAFILLIPYLFTIIRPYPQMIVSRNTRIWLLLFFLASLVFLYPRYAIPHWSVSLIFLAIISGITCGDWTLHLPSFDSKWPFGNSIYAAFSIWWLLSGIGLVWIFWSDSQPQRLLKFDHIASLVEQLDGKLPAGGNIVLLPDNEAVSNLYYYLGETPPSFWLMNYPWFMNETSIAQWMEVVEAEKPETLLFFENLEDLSQTAPELLLYVANNYESIDSVEWEGRIVHIMQRQTQ
jgi:hypothetical protein